MRKYFIYPLLALMLAMIAGCQNNGHIGWIFGVWRVAEYSVDGEAQTEPLIGSTTFAFQNNVVEVVAILDEYNSTYETFGTWEEDGDTFIIDFTHGDDNTAPGTGQYAAPRWLGMTSDEPMVMELSDRKGDAFTLTWQTSDGKKNVYKFRKTW